MPPRMQIFVLLLSRLVPISLVASLALVGSRYIHDLLLPRGRRQATLAFAGVALIGLIAIGPPTIRAFLIVGALEASQRQQWQKADRLFTEYDRWDGRRTDRTIRRWAFVRMNLGSWEGAEAILGLDAAASPQARVLLGICQYYRNEATADATLAAIPDVTDTQLCIRDYLRGRIAERHGDDRRAISFYGHSAQLDANFFPATYQGIRLFLKHGDIRTASLILEQFTRRYPRQGEAPDVMTLRAAIASKTVPPEKEFVIVSD